MAKEDGKPTKKEICEYFGTDECPKRKEKYPLPCNREWQRRKGNLRDDKKCGYAGRKIHIDYKRNKMIYVYPDGKEEFISHIDKKKVKEEN